MGKMLFGLIGVCCLSGFLIANPDNQTQDVLKRYNVEDKGVMVACALEFKRNNPESPLTIDNLTANKVGLARQISEISDRFSNIFGPRKEKALVNILINESNCPVKSPSKPKKRKILPSIQVFQSSEVDCGVPSPKTPPVKSNAITAEDELNRLRVIAVEDKLNRLHRVWKNKVKSDSDLQALLEQENSNSVGRKRRNSNDK